MLRRFIKLFVFIVLLAVLLLGAGIAFFPLPGQIPVLMYHFIGDKRVAAERKNFVSRESFAFQMAYLDFFGYRILSLDDLYAIRSGQRKPRGREIVITFDDGNYTFRDEAIAVLEKHQFPAAVFVVSESALYERNGSLEAEEIAQLARNPLITIGSHSMTHPLLSRLTPQEIERELKGSREALEKMTGKPVYYLAYPSGNLDIRVVEEAKQAGYRLAFTTSPKKLGMLEEGDWSLPRVKISRSSDLPIAFWAKTTGIYEAFKVFRSRLKRVL